MTIKITKKINKIKIQDIPLIQTIFTKFGYGNNQEYYFLAKKLHPIGIFTNPKNNKKYIIGKGYDNGLSHNYATYYHVLELNSEVHTNNIQPNEKLKYQIVLDDDAEWNKKKFRNLTHLKYFFENEGNFKLSDEK